MTWSLTAALIIGATQSSKAADLELRLLDDWNSIYIGGHVGAQFAEISHTFPPPTPPLVFDHSDNGEDIAGGALAGFNWQFAPQFLIGGEFDATFSDVETTGANPLNPLARDIAEIGQSYSVRGRVGYVFNDLLFFASGGVSWAEVESNAFDEFGADLGVSEEFFFGYQLGGGIEWKAEKYLGVPVNLRAEYLFSDYGTESLAFSGGKFVDRVNVETHTARAAVIWQLPARRLFR